MAIRWVGTRRAWVGMSGPMSPEAGPVAAPGKDPNQGRFGEDQDRIWDMVFHWGQTPGKIGLLGDEKGPGKGSKYWPPPKSVWKNFGSVFFERFSKSKSVHKKAKGSNEPFVRNQTCRLRLSATVPRGPLDELIGFPCAWAATVKGTQHYAILQYVNSAKTASEHRTRLNLVASKLTHGLPWNESPRDRGDDCPVRSPSAAYWIVTEDTASGWWDSLCNTNRYVECDSFGGVARLKLFQSGPNFVGYRQYTKGYLGESRLLLFWNFIPLTLAGDSHFRPSNAQSQLRKHRLSLPPSRD